MSETQGYVTQHRPASTGLPYLITHRLRVTWVAFAVALTPVPSGAQEIGPVTFRDSLVMRQLVFRAPCPNPIPRGWTLVDSTLGRPPRCNLVEVAARAIAQYAQARPGSPRGDPWRALCARVVVGRNTSVPGLPGDWMVLFDLAPDRPAWVIIDRLTGDIGATMFGMGQGADRPRCLTR